MARGREGAHRSLGRPYRGQMVLGAQAMCVCVCGGGPAAPRVHGSQAGCHFSGRKNWVTGHVVGDPFEIKSHS